MTESNTSLCSDATAETYLVTDVPTDELIPLTDLLSGCSIPNPQVENLLFTGKGDAYVSNERVRAYLLGLVLHQNVNKDGGSNVVALFPFILARH